MHKKKTMLTASRVFSFCLMLAMLGVQGCGPSPDSELERYIHDTEARKAKPLEPLPDLEMLPKYSYPENVIQRSPFKPKETPGTADRYAPNMHRLKEPLEKFPLDSLKFVGIWKQDQHLWALIQTPDAQGMIVRVQVGNYMGQNFGKIIQITENTIVLEEVMQVAGLWQKQRISLSLNAHE